jgi:hypothetical protein
LSYPLYSNHTFRILIHKKEMKNLSRYQKLIKKKHLPEKTEEPNHASSDQKIYLNRNLSRPIQDKWYHYNEYRQLIDNILEKTMISVRSSNPQWPLHQNQLKKIFWEIVNGIPQNFEDPHYFIAILTAYDINSAILKDKGRITPESIELQILWFEYLQTKLIVPSTKDNALDPQIYRQLSLEIPLSKEYASNIVYILNTTSPDNIPTMINQKKEFLKILKVFADEFGLYFNLFEKKCNYIGEKIINTKKTGLDHIFGLIHDPQKQKIERTPSGKFEIINDLLIELKHIKNCIKSHDHFEFDNLINPKKVTLRDTFRNRITFEKQYTINDLHQKMYQLHLLATGFRQIGLWVLFQIKIKKGEKFSTYPQKNDNH